MLATEPHILDAIAERRSIRVFQPRAVECEKVEALLEAARLAPSSINLQHFRVLVVDRPDDLEIARSAAYRMPVVVSAPLILVCMADMDADADVGEHLAEVAAASPHVDIAGLRSGRGVPISLKMGRQWGLINAAVATQNLVLQATSMGLGTCWNHHFEHEEVRAHFRIPVHLELLTLIAVGYPAETPGPRPRRASVRWVGENG